jgi:hypothetical protein
VADFEQIFDMANDNIAAWKPQQKSKDDIHISHLELRISAPDINDLNSSFNSEERDFYRDVSDESESDDDYYWEDDTQDNESVEEEVASSSDSTVTSAALERASFDPIE